MKTYLFRGGMTPFENIPVERVITRNYLGRNTGNIVYQGAVMRALMTDDDTKFIMDRYLYNDTDADWIQERCDAFIVPLADTFRPDNHDMRRVADLVRKLDMPCVVVGAGLRCELNVEPTAPHPFDDDVKYFMNAMLEKSATVGLRGHTTAEYLKHLGYREGEHFRVIGCPSMYMNGAKLPRRELAITPDSHINVNMNVYSQATVNKFLMGVLDAYPNSVYTAQTLFELRTLYLCEKYGSLESGDDPEKPYPRHITDELYVQDRVRFFINVCQWMDFLSKMDLSVGGRVHGNVAAIQSGCPTAVIVKDRRMSELADYHSFPRIMRDEVDSNWTLEEFLSHIDFDTMHTLHPANFENYVKFLDENGLDHIFTNNPTPAPGSTPFDKMTAAAEQQTMPTTAAGLSAEELATRWRKMVKEEAKFRKELEKRHIAWERRMAAEERDIAVRNARIDRRLRRLLGRVARKAGLRR